MGRESASYFLALAPELEEAVVLTLREGGAEPGDSDHTWIDLRVRDLPPEAARQPLRDEDGRELGAPTDDGWSLRLEEDYGRRRAAFVKRIGDFTAPISADHVYMYVHQTRWNRDNDAELAWHREREVSQIEQMWEGEEPELPAEHPDRVDD
jgi:hypothetical protein